MKKTPLIIISIALALAATVSIQSNRNTPSVAAPAAVTITKTTTGAAQNNVTLTVGDQSYGAYISGNRSVLDVMYILASSSNFKFTGKEYPSLGYFVESINGKKNGDGTYWILYINGKSSDLGASNATIHAGDTVEWRYEKGY